MAVNSDGDSKQSAFERASEGAGGSGGPISEFWYYLRSSRKWWIAPLLFFLFVVGALLVLGGTSVAPLIYTLF